MKSGRISYVDTAKGLTILLVIVGHSFWAIRFPGLIDWIYSFHMPLFFILSGYFISPLPLTSAWGGVKNLFKALLVPYFVTAIVICSFDLIGVYIHQESLLEALFQSLEKVFWASGWDEGKELFATIPSIGAIWFLFALFWSKIIYALLKNYYYSLELLWIVVLLFICSFISIKVIRLPLSFQAGLSAVLFLYIGDKIHSYKVVDKVGSFHPLTMWISIILWIVCSLFFGHITLSICNYGRFQIVNLPVCLLGSIFVIYTCKHIVFNILSSIGRWSLYLLCGHALSWSFFRMISFDLKKLDSSIVSNFIQEVFIQLVFAFVMGYVMRIIIDFVVEVLYKKTA